MLSLIAPKFKDEVGLYRDDGIAVCNATLRQIEKTKQEVSSVFRSIGLKITIETNKKTINFLDVTFDSFKWKLHARVNEAKQIVLCPPDE